MESVTISTIIGVIVLGVIRGAAFCALVAAITCLIVKLKRWNRRRKSDRRIIEQAKAIGAWDKRPTPLGGRALELYAWEEYGIKRLHGESDRHLRLRCMNEADNELANSPW